MKPSDDVMEVVAETLRSTMSPEFKIATLMGMAIGVLLDIRDELKEQNKVKPRSVAKPK